MQTGSKCRSDALLRVVHEALESAAQQHKAGRNISSSGGADSALARAFSAADRAGRSVLQREDLRAVAAHLLQQAGAPAMPGGAFGGGGGAFGGGSGAFDGGSGGTKSAWWQGAEEELAAWMDVASAVVGGRGGGSGGVTLAAVREAMQEALAAREL